MTAVFGKLQGQTLELRNGLNILQAPNETGKSTWCAFLLSMLYGVNSRERERADFIPDKIRYAPWSGAAMSGRLDCRVGDRELTLTRSTRRQTAPLGDFQAVYTGTGDFLPELTGQSCGEALLGVTREVYERSAFIRQGGLPITQDPGLERRIAALISSGEEDTSYSEAADALKKQLNRRRHNKTGQLPALEAQLQETERQLAEAELAEHDRWEASQKRQVLMEAETAAQAAEQRAQQLRQRLEEERIPENETIGRLRGAIVNLETTRKAVEKARAERDEAAKALLRAEAAVNESPFAGQSPDSARKEAAAPPATTDWQMWPGLLTIVLGTIATFILFYIVGAALTGSLWQKPAALAVLLGGLGITWLLAARLRRVAVKKAQDTALTKRFGTADPTAIQQLADTYCKLYEARETAQAEADRRSAAAESLYAALSSNEQGLLLEVRRFAPSAFDLSAADHLLRTCAVRRKELAEAETAAKDARVRAELLAQQAPNPAAGDTVPAAPPPRPRAGTENQLAQIRAQLTAARSAADQLEGRLHAAGDPVVLSSARALLLEQIRNLEGEYSALQLAREVLDEANTSLQNRFSPALGRRAAEIFFGLTGGRYSGVALDRTLRLSAQPAGDTLSRDAGVLSAGAAGQLYLAVRLAICDLVLPQDRHLPIVLDDALVSFDDDRCAAALRYLKEAARERQILLFTCHSREAEFFAGDGEVLVQRLTDGA